MYLERAHPAFLTTIVVLVLHDKIFFISFFEKSFEGVTEGRGGDWLTLEAPISKYSNGWEWVDFFLAHVPRQLCSDLVHLMFFVNSYLLIWSSSGANHININYKLFSFLRFLETNALKNIN